MKNENNSGEALASAIIFVGTVWFLKKVLDAVFDNNNRTIVISESTSTQIELFKLKNRVSKLEGSKEAA